MSESATLDIASNLKQLGDQIANLTLKEAKNLSDYLEQTHGIKAAAGGAVVMTGPAAAAAPVVEKTEFDVVLTGFGDKKLEVVKVVRNLTGASLMDAKKMVEGVPSKIKEAVSKEEAEKAKAELVASGATVEVK